ncbi:MAG: acylneuraminate cytidylyltransferase family protein [Candidatus Saganbacteria bacterium]|nr:acylneuraminate cytidylyltransferase family protein [Candidatus Saganbacteria bacterium]
MFDNKKILAVIPARGGSKGLPDKNISMLAGKPLIAWTVEEAKKSKYIDRLILSSENSKIIKVAKQFGCEVPFVRPAELAQDETPGIEVVLHVLASLPGYDYVVVLQPTSPLRKVTDIDGGIEACLSQCASACVSLTASSKSPYWMYSLDEGKRMKLLFEGSSQSIRRQDLPKVYVLNGAVSCAKVTWLLEKKSFLTKETLAYVMPKERSVDIDSRLDLLLCDLLLSKGAA